MNAEIEVEHIMGAQSPCSTVDRLIAALAKGQHGVVARHQLRSLGMGRRAIGHRLRVGRLHCVHRGVYAVGHTALTQHGRWMAAVLAAGPDAVLSHRAAAALWRIGPASRLEVTIPYRRAAKPRLVLHQSVLEPDEVTEVDGIAVTTVARTLLDLAAVWPAHRVERAMHEAEVRRLTSPTSLDDLLERHPGRRGSGALRAILAAERLGAQVTRGELEARFLRFVDEHDLPRPATNVLVAGFEVDCAWRERRVIVELDGHAVHVTRVKFERDRERDRVLQAAGWRVVRVTWRQLHEEASGLAADLHALLMLR